MCRQVCFGSKLRAEALNRRSGKLPGKKHCKTAPGLWKKPLERTLTGAEP